MCCSTHQGRRDASLLVVTLNESHQRLITLISGFSRLKLCRRLKSAAVVDRGEVLPALGFRRTSRSFWKSPGNDRLIFAFCFDQIWMRMCLLYPSIPIKPQAVSTACPLLFFFFKKKNNVCLLGSSKLCLAPFVSAVARSEVSRHLSLRHDFAPGASSRPDFLWQTLLPVRQRRD